MLQQDSEDQLLLQLLELQHAAIEISEVEITAANVSWAKGYPHVKEAFWNCEAFMWQRKIDSKKRTFITQELKKHCLLDTNILDIGSGSYCYLPSVAFDCSLKMLAFNDTAIKKVTGDLEKKWPFDQDEFDTITAVFVLNYLSDLDFVFSEVKRVLRSEGRFITVISATGVSKRHQLQEKNSWSFDIWQQRFLEYFDLLEVYEQEGLYFFVCTLKI